jgi:cytochrome b561
MQPHFDIPGQTPNSAPRNYSRAAMLLHWAIAALILFEFTSALSFSRFNPGDAGYFRSAYRMHMSAGMALLALSVSNVAWRLLHAYPALPRDMHAVTRVLAKVVKILLYLFIVAVPATGWTILSARNSPAAIAGGFSWPILGPLAHMSHEERVSLNDVLLPIHSTLSYVGIGLVALHVAASLYHHFWRGDEVLTRILPGPGNRTINRWGSE